MNLRNAIIAIAVVVAAFFAYSFFLKGSDAPALVSERPALLAENVKGRELLRVLLSLRNIKLDESIFASPLFTALEDFTIILPPSGNVGRPNPFAPIGQDGAAAQAPKAPAPKPPAP